jgi:hypothetical protein
MKSVEKPKFKPGDIIKLPWRAERICKIIDIEADYYNVKIYKIMVIRKGQPQILFMACKVVDDYGTLIESGKVK